MLVEVVRQIVRGFLMGSADIVPGVSGGTVALVLGVYKRLLTNVRRGASVLGRVVKGDVRSVGRGLAEIEWHFLLLLGGVALAFLVLRHPFETLLVERSEEIAAVFSGLVGASIWLVWRSLPAKDALRIVLLVGTAVVTFVLLGLQAGAVADPSLVAFAAAGAVAICAMILPGISGSFVLLMLGMYAAVLGGSLPELAVFGLGAVVGLALFSTLLTWLLANHEASLLAVLIGIMAGSYRVLWPWPNGVGFVSVEADAVVGGTDLGWADPGSLAVGVVLAAIAFGATLLIVRVAEARDATVGLPADRAATRPGPGSAS